MDCVLFDLENVRLREQKMEYCFFFNGRRLGKQAGSGLYYLPKLQFRTI